MAVTHPAPQPPLNATVAARIRAELALRGMTQRDLAKRLGVPELWISRRLSVKSGRAVTLNLDELDHISQVLGIPVQSLLDPNWLPRLGVTSQYRRKPDHRPALALVRNVA